MPDDAGARVNHSPYVGLQPATSVGLGHLVRVASLRSILRVPSEILGPVDARLSDTGMQARRRLFRSRPAEATVYAVDNGHLPETVLRRRLEHPGTPVVWIRRALFKPEQIAMQAGYLHYCDQMIIPDEVVPQPPDAVSRMADDHGKGGRVGVVHAYQASSAPLPRREHRIFLALGAYTPAHRDAFISLRTKLEAARLPYCWSAHDRTPQRDGFPPRLRVDVRQALGAKARCSAYAGEAGYNSVYENLYLGGPMLLLANETEGREAQQRRVELAMEVSPNAFDASRPDHVAAWLERAAEADHPRYVPSAVAGSRGLANLAEQIERTFDVATTQTH